MLYPVLALSSSLEAIPAMRRYGILIHLHVIGEKVAGLLLISVHVTEEGTQRAISKLYVGKKARMLHGPNAQNIPDLMKRQLRTRLGTCRI